jgi:septum formation protein
LLQETIVQPRPLLLASSSPRRRQLLRQAGYEFDVIEPPFEEPSFLHPSVAPERHAEALAYFKACSVADHRREVVVLGADTLAAFDGVAIGKPEDRDDARRILKRLSGTTHKVVTGVALVDATTNRRAMRHDVSIVRVKELSDAMIEAYLDSGEWESKAGAYGIQDQNDPFVERVEGSLTNVVGLPMEVVEAMFREWVEGK